MYNSSVHLHGYTPGLSQATEDALEELEALIAHCHGLDVCVALSQHKQDVNQLVVFDTLSFVDYTEDPDWITIVSLGDL